jgi:hypothetical protein
MKIIIGFCRGVSHIAARGNCLRENDIRAVYKHTRLAVNGVLKYLLKKGEFL